MRRNSEKSPSCPSDDVKETADGSGIGETLIGSMTRSGLPKVKRLKK